MNVQEHKSQLAMAFERFYHRPVSRFACWVLAGLMACVLFADVLAVYRYDDENREYSYCPPTKIHWMDQGRLSLPYVYAQELSFDQHHQRVFKDDVSRKYPIKLFFKGRLWGVEAPARLYYWGADSQGRDIYSRILYGGRISLSIGILGSLIAFSLGILVGGIAGYYGGRVDQVLMRLCEVFMLLPGFYLMLALRSVVPDNINSFQIYLMVILILSFIGWATLARIIRGLSLSIAKRDFVLAAKAMGVGDLRIILTHVLPHTMSYSLVAIMMSIPAYMMAEAGLSLLGLGIQDPIPSWGNMLSASMGIVQIKFYPWIMIPGIFIFVTVMCFNIIGDGLRDAFDPMMGDSHERAS